MKPKQQMQTKEDFFIFEKECQELFNKFYTENNWKYERVYGKENKLYDVKIQVKDKWYKIEEKTREIDYKDLLVEIEQDTESKAPGWLYYTQADYLFYMVNKKTIYLVNMNRLKNHIENFKDYYNQKVSIKGWGKTVNIVIPWHTILYNKIGKRLR